MKDLSHISIKEISHQVFFEKRRPLGTEHLFGILHAIKNKLQVKYTYQKYWGNTISTRTVAPHALKEFNHRWYIIAYDITDKSQKLKNYALDCVSELAISSNLLAELTHQIALEKNSYIKISLCGDLIQKILIQKGV